MTARLPASLSIDLDNAWAYLKIHGDAGWDTYPTYLDRAIPRALDLADDLGITMSLFVVGRDAADPRHADLMAELGRSRHEIGNHSFEHEPWMDEAGPAAVKREIATAHEAITEAAGRQPVGYRGPGFAKSPATFEALGALGYRYDASSLATFIGPLARRYYFATSDLSPEERDRRRGLFGSFRDGFAPNRPHDLPGGLTEIPVTTVPLVRAPFHFSYVLWLAERSEALARRYFSLGLWTCRRAGIGPSLLLHPLDFLGPEDAPRLRFFPGMATPAEVKRARLREALTAFTREFEVGTVAAHVEAVGG